MNSQSINPSFPNLPSNPESPRLYDHLQHIYNSDALENKHFSNQHKKLYYRLIEQNQQRKQQKKSLEKEVNQYENQQIDFFWKNRQNELRERQKRKKQMVDAARDVNNGMYAQKVLSKSMVMPNSHELANADYYENVAKYEAKRQEEKELKTKFLSEGQMYNDYKQYQQYLEKQATIEAERKKSAENDQLQQKRLQNLDKWRKKHLEEHNKQAFEVWDRARRSRMSQQDALENYIVFQGARQLNERTSKMKNQVFERENAKKQQYIRELHNQLEDNQYRTGNDQKNQKDYERRIITERNQMMMERERLLKEAKNQQNKQHLETLKAQHRPRILLPEKQKVEFPGLGSPVHIGKAMGDDRRRQLQWLEKNLYKELTY